MFHLEKSSVWLILFFLFQYEFFSSSCVPLDCQENFSCIPLYLCNLDNDMKDFVYPCDNGLNLICCPNDFYNNFNETRINDAIIEKFPLNCGTVTTSDRITGGTIADFGQFPWMALLGYHHKEIKILQFLCGGSIITKNYILTAAHCIDMDNSLELSVVRLGELNLSTDVDCKIILGKEICAEPHVDKSIEKFIIHQQYDNKKLVNDIGLIKVVKEITFTEYIRPICLPFDHNFHKNNFVDRKFIISGWGKTDPKHVIGSQTLQYANVKVWNQTKCNNSIPLEVRPILDSQICATGQHNEDACKGDSGGPLINVTIDHDHELRYFQIGIVSFSSAFTCGINELPTVYTRVDKFLKWIIENI